MLGLLLIFPERVHLILNIASRGQAGVNSHFFPHAFSTIKGAAGGCLGLTLLSLICDKPEGI